MSKIPEANKRMFGNIFICKNCGSRVRSEPRKIIEGKVKCRKCQKRAFRVVRKK
jgi:formylmethanofuran dehydrogenase subunit E